MPHKFFTWMDELFQEFTRTNSYKLGPYQKQFVMRGLGFILMAGVGLGIVLGLILFGFGLVKY